jgi:hypothetical protein
MRIDDDDTRVADAVVLLLREVVFAERAQELSERSLSGLALAERRALRQRAAAGKQTHYRPAADVVRRRSDLAPQPA